MTRKITTKKGNSNLFGHKDLDANIAAGFTYTEILKWLDNNQDKLWSGNQAGGKGGLYDTVANKAKEERQELRIKVLADNKITKKELKSLKAAGVPQKKIDKMFDNLPKVQETQQPVVGDPTGQYEETPVSINTNKPNESAVTLVTRLEDQGQKLTGSDVTRISDLLSITPEKVVQLAQNKTDVKIGANALAILDKQSGGNGSGGEGDGQSVDGKDEKGFFDTKLKVEGLDAALEEYSPSQLLEFHDKGDLKIGKGALNKIKEKAEEALDESTGLRRVMEDKFNESARSRKDSDTGIYYKTYGKRNTVLRIGNLHKHRYEGSAYKDIKIVDYDASIQNYDPTKLGFVTDVTKGNKGKIKSVTFKEYKPGVLQGTKMSDIRTDERRADYKERGLIKAGDGSRIKESSKVTKYKTMKDGKVAYVPVQTDDRGNLKQLSFDGSVSTAKFPKELSDADSYSAGIGKETSFFDKVNTKASARNSLATIASTKSRGRALLQGIANN